MNINLSVLQGIYIKLRSVELQCHVLDEGPEKT